MADTTWSSTTPSIQSEIIRLLDDATFDVGGEMHDLLLPWANRVVVEICNEFPIRDHLQTSSATIDTTNYIWTLPTTSGYEYFKKHERFTRARVDDNYVDIVGVEVLNSNDPDHSETSIASTPNCVAIEGKYLYVYPKWAGTVVIENYLRLPVDMSATTDIPDLPMEHLRVDLIVAGVVGKYGFPALNENTKALAYYNRHVNPKSGLFFELLAAYQKYHDTTNTYRTNQVKFY